MNNVAEQEDAVGAALRGLVRPDPTADEEPLAGGTATGIPEADQVSAETTDDEATEDQPQEQTTATDDIDSLKTRLAERDAEVKRYEERLQATSERSRQSLDSLNQQKMRLASQRDRARQVLEKALSSEGVDKAEAERLLAEIRGGYNPASANYVPPLQEAQVVSDTDDKAIDGNQWLNDRGLTQAESESLGAYIRSAQLTPREQRLAATDIYSFLTVVEPRWRAAETAAPKTDATKAVQTVARVQKQAAKAASASLGAQTTSAGKSAQRKQAKLTDEQLSGLIRETWEGR